ncbi:MAG: GtrA family protein [Nanoarchaeota archaeon]
MGSSIKHFRQFAGFSGIGIIAFLMDLALLAFLTEIIGLFYLVSAFISFICAASIHYTISRFFVFTTTSRSFKRGYAYFIAIAVFNLFLLLVLLRLFVENAGVHYIVARVMVGALVSVWGFLINKKLTFI